MCGRIHYTEAASSSCDYWEAVEETTEITQAYNIAPQAMLGAVLFSAGCRRYRSFRWGLVPAWADDPKIGNKLTNARCETVLEKPSFRDAFRERRCLVLANGFYEWDRRTGQPYYFCFADGQPLAIAGLWERWQRSNQVLDTVTLITVPANDLMQPIHHRMPCLIGRELADRWLKPAQSTKLTELFQPFAGLNLTRWPVRLDVNNSRNQGPKLIEKVEPLPAPPIQCELFFPAD